MWWKCGLWAYVSKRAECESMWAHVYVFWWACSQQNVLISIKLQCMIINCPYTIRSFPLQFPVYKQAVTPESLGKYTRLGPNISPRFARGWYCPRLVYFPVYSGYKLHLWSLNVTFRFYRYTGYQIKCMFLNSVSTPNSFMYTKLCMVHSPYIWNIVSHLPKYRFSAVFAGPSYEKYKRYSFFMKTNHF